jgi:nicotinate-nucleotide adenylyltransferase
MKIGILGGSFNPVHNGHIRLAIESLELLGLDQVDLVPAAVPPHKSSAQMLPFSFRVRLLNEAVSRCPGLVVNDLEGQRPGPSYTVDTLREYRTRLPRGDLYFLLGSQDLMTLPEWREWQVLISLTHFVVVGRNGADMDSVQDFLARYFPEVSLRKTSSSTWFLPSGTRIIGLPIPDLAISSSLIREKWSQGKSLTYLLPEKVEKALLNYSLEDGYEDR